MIDLPEPAVTSDVWPWSTDTDVPTFSANSDWPKISIITPSYNQGKYIEETIRSVLAQNYPNLEYIIIDGGSTDETLEIIKKYEPWISYWVSEPDNGQSHAINKGLKKCTGEIFNWLNSDDFYTPGALFEVASKFKDNSSLHVVSGYERYLRNGSGEEEIFAGTLVVKDIVKTIELSQIGQPSTFFKTNKFKELGPIPENLHYVMDGEMWVRYLLLNGQGKFSKIEKTLVNFRLHNDSKTVNNIHSFHYERNCIICDVQRFAKVPQAIIDHWVTITANKTPVYTLNRPWEINEKYITKKQLRTYFIKKYINFQFQHNNLRNVFFGIKQLIKDKQFNAFMLRSLIKLVIKAG
ncbi:glycosyl transferase family 2 [Pontibacter ummariensis]|uniref:Glycosyl transferase family 2 n=1 Tax=Pontibacter ummariensis TaxID=1610492 RepID=A0A239BMF2_9BACT|nr:glycosyltransferase family 2 protein [Pontibacter ummariensis]PRY15761.1 glycosyl transferase family 2 [Pontibacter ummariensis]SNS08802.1 Glycosyl transferase family 2 [Pontibacter ummariensis]